MDKKIRILGYYHFPNQTMKPEINCEDEARELAPLLECSLNSLLYNDEVDDNLKEMIKTPSVFIFKDESGHLYGYFTKDKNARITDVKYNKGAINQVPLKYKAWFYPGKKIHLIVKKDSTRENSNEINKDINSNMEEKKEIISSPDVNTDAMNEVFDNMYITNVEKRLRELNAPSEIDKKRWVWELIQNAKDTIALDPNRNEINVRIEINGDTVKFRHDGAPFTAKARYGLLYKYSGGKENQESTGRFGTGFLTTHCLSKIVTIESNMYSNKSQTELCGFEVTMYRDGLVSSELIDGLKKMRASEHFFKQTFDWTTFTYHVNTDSGRTAVRLGIENFHENIAQTMLFCKEIKTIELNDNGEITRIVKLPHIKVTDDITLAEYEIVSSTSTCKRRFLYTNYSGSSQELSERYRADRLLRLDVAIEIDENNNIVNHSGKTSHFCVLPLVGIEEQLNEPVIVNSPDFEPDSERQSLMLSGQKWMVKDDKNIITETGINQMIYDQVFPLYEKLVSFLSEKHYGCLYYLATGLDKTKTHKNLDKDWYAPNVIQKYRDVLFKYPIVKSFNDACYKKLEECIIVKEGKESDESALYEILAALYPTKLVAENHEWASQIWKSGIDLWNTEDVCSDVESKLNWSNIILTGKSLGEWYNEFLKHVASYDERLLKEHALLPDMNGLLRKKDAPDFKQGEHVTSFIIDLLFKLGKDVKPSLLNDEVTAITLDAKYNSQSYSSDINKLAKGIIDDNYVTNKVTRLLPLLAIIPDNTDKYTSDFIIKRKDFFSICKDLHSLTDAQSSCDNNLLEGAWKDIDVWFVTHVLQSLKNLASLSSLPSGLDAKWLNRSLKALHIETNRLNTYEVLPNQNGTFCKQNTLYEDAGVPEELKNSVFDSISLKYKDILLHKEIDASAFAIIQNKTVSSFAGELKSKLSKLSSYSYGNYFRNSYHYYPQSVLDNVSLYMLSILPSNKETELYKYQESLYRIAGEVLGSENTFVASSIEYDSVELWQTINDYAANQVAEKLCNLGTLETLCNHLSDCGEVHALELLNAFYSFVAHNQIAYTSFSIFPNQIGEFKDFNSLKKEDGSIDDIIKDVIACLVSPEDNFRFLLMDKRCSIQPQATLNSDNAFKLVDDKVYEFYQIPAKWEDDNYINAVHMLIEVWKDQSGQFTEKNFPRTKPIEDSIVLNVVWKKEKRELLMNVSSKLTDEQIQIIIENSAQIGELTNKVQELENSNKDLQSKNEELQRQIDALTTSPVSEPTPTGKPEEPTEPPTPPAIINFKTLNGEVKGYNVQESQYGGLSQEQIVSFVQQAKTDVAVYLEELGYVIDWDYVEMPTYSQLYGVKDANGERIPVVVHSYRWTGRDFDLNWYDWNFLNSSEKSMLWVVPSTGGPQCVPLCSLPMRKVTIPIEGQSLAEQSKLIALATVAETYSYVRFDFGTQIPINQKTPVPFRFLPEEMKLGVESIAQICNNEIPLIHKELPYMGYNSALSYKRPIKSIAVSNEESCSIEDLNASRVEMSVQITSDNSEDLI